MSIKYRGQTISGPAGPGVPTGGTPGQIIEKTGSGDYEVGWRNPPSNPNLLDNWYFVDPINQRGQTEYTGNGRMYCMDRWLAGGGNGSVVLSNDGVSIPMNKLIVQRVENSVSNSLIGKSITFSVLLSDGTLHFGTKIFQLGADVYFVSNSSVDLIWWHNGGGGFGILAKGAARTAVAAKLELGTQQTLAHQDASGNWVLNDSPPNKALELAKCQRYYQQSWVGGPITAKNKPSNRLMAAAVSVVALSSVRFPVVMRANPTIKIFSILGTEGEVLSWIGDSPVKCISHYVSPNSFAPYNTQSGFKAGNFYSFHYTASADL